MTRALQVRKAHWPAGGHKSWFTNTPATVKGGVYAIDIGGSSTYPTNLDTIIANSTTTMDLLSPMVVADNIYTAATTARCTFGEGVICQVLVEGTTDIAKGDQLKPVNGQAYLVKATTAYTDANGDHYNAIALEAFTTNSTGLIMAIFFSVPRF